MPGGKRDSSKTRVQPVFDRLWEKGRDWLPDLLALPKFGASNGHLSLNSNLTLLEKYWQPTEKGLDPPVSLLSWLVRNLWTLPHSTGENGERAKLLKGDHEAIAEALNLLRSGPQEKAWHIFEGRTYPDVFLVAEDALVVIEGKRTERDATTDTKWLPGRHQMWRHIDAAWELRGRRAVYGFFVVKGEDGSGTVPERWRAVASRTLSPEVLNSSFPHRSEEERRMIASSFLGVTTWCQICERFGIDCSKLPDTVP